MKLQDLAAPKNSKQINKVMESYFGSGLAVNGMNRKQLAQMLNRVRHIIGEHNQSTARHHTERNASYLKLMMMEQALSTRLAEMTPAPANGTTQPGQSSTTTKPVDPKLKAAQDKLKNKQPITPQEQELINNAAVAVAEDRLRRAYRMLQESEVQTAQVVLAAQDMVDKMQSMIEEVSELQFKDLPALVDTIKNRPEMGDEMANQFNTDASAALTGLLQNVQGAKQQLDAALNVVQGKAPAGGMAADLAAAGAGLGPDEVAGMAAGEVSGGMPPEPEADMMPPAEAPVPPAGSEQSLGRARR